MIGPVGKACTGCGACAAVCPKGCISFERREFGHLFPVVDETACVHCGSCRNVCPALAFQDAEPFIGESFAFQAFDRDLLADSSSGGAFGTVAARWVASGGVVYGAVWERGFGARHARAAEPRELAPLRRSKYVQSSLEGVYARISADLGTGMSVLFVGTPCQVAAVKAVCGRNASRGRLATIDLVCHGVPSAALFEDYVGWAESRAGVEMTAYASRDKVRAGWSYLGSVAFGEAEAQVIRADDPYVVLFGQGAVFRPSCYTCSYACAARVGDLTLGDLWGAESLDLDFDLDLGLSAVLVNTNTGRELLDLCAGDARIVAVPFEDIARNNRNLVAASEVPVQRVALAEAYERGGFPELAGVTSRAFCREAAKNRVKQLLPTGLKRALKRAIGKVARDDG